MNYDENRSDNQNAGVVMRSVASVCHVSAVTRALKRNEKRAEKSPERDGSGEQASQKMKEQEVTYGERERSRQQAESAAYSPLQPNISLMSSR